VVYFAKSPQIHAKNIHTPTRSVIFLHYKFMTVSQKSRLILRYRTICSAFNRTPDTVPLHRLTGVNKDDFYEERSRINTNCKWVDRKMPIYRVLFTSK